ncbi:MAG: tetratricopeptide repeat protein [Bacteroidetes bacterium]|nr:tetratricopeptide repeat protein [Bacteroidota bacterium]
MTKQEIEEILEQAKEAMTSNEYHNAEQLSSTIINADVTSLECNEQTEILTVAYRIHADSFLKRGLYTQALPNAKKSLSLQPNSTEERANSLLVLGLVCLKTADYSQATTHFLHALEIYRHLNIKMGVASSNLNLGLVYSYLSQQATALEYYSKAIEEFTTLGLKKNIAIIWGNIGTIYHVQSDYFKALEYYHQAVAIHQEFNNLPETGTVFGNIGSAYRDIADYHSALEYYEKAIGVYDELGILSNKAIILGNIGVTYRNLSDFPRAIEYLEKSVVMHQELGMKGGVAMFMGNIGITYSQMLDYPRAIEYLQKAYVLSQELNLAVDTAIFASNLGKAYYDISEFENALNYLEEALIVLEEFGRREEEAGTKGIIGLVYSNPLFSGYNPQKAEEYFLGTISNYGELGATLYRYQFEKYLADLYKQEKRWEEYATHIEKYHELYIEIQNEEVKKQADKFGWERKIADMEKQKEIELLKTEAEKMNMQIKIESQTRELDTSLQEIIKKNNLLQLVQSSIKKIRPFTRGEGIQYVEQLHDRVTRSIAKLETISELDKQWVDVHGTFMKKLQDSFPELTTMELKIAALIRMKLSSSNMASVLFLSQRTVESHRHSLRKKMGISASDNIYASLDKYK